MQPPGTKVKSLVPWQAIVDARCHVGFPGLVRQGIGKRSPVSGWGNGYAWPQSGTVKGHCRNLHAPRPNARKPKPGPREKQLAKLIRRRDSTNDMALNAKLSAEIRALRATNRQPKSSQAGAPAAGELFGSVPRSKSSWVDLRVGPRAPRLESSSVVTHACTLRAAARRRRLVRTAYSSL